MSSVGLPASLGPLIEDAPYKCLASKFVKIKNYGSGVDKPSPLCNGHLIPTERSILKAEKFSL